jgi:hypothetical protein
MGTVTRRRLAGRSGIPTSRVGVVVVLATLLVSGLTVGPSWSATSTGCVTVPLDGHSTTACGALAGVDLIDAGNADEGLPALPPSLAAESLSPSEGAHFTEDVIAWERIDRGLPGDVVDTAFDASVDAAATSATLVDPVVPADLVSSGSLVGRSTSAAETIALWLYDDRCVALGGDNLAPCPGGGHRASILLAPSGTGRGVVLDCAAGTPLTGLVTTACVIGEEGASSTSVSAPDPATPAPGAASMAVAGDGDGYWVMTPDGSLSSFGTASDLGQPAGPLNQPVVDMAATPDGRGYWLAAADGGVFAFGDAGFYGSAGAMALNAPVVGITPTPDGRGYWLVAADGGVFAFGDAAFHGAA